MSASLVGSEMCIRDRVCTASRMRTRATPGPRTHVRCVSHLTTRTGSVSYTHLTLPTICSV
eukprot:6980459-Alexandrium_andersonii.AAC.1